MQSHTRVSATRQPLRGAPGVPTEDVRQVTIVAMAHRIPTAMALTIGLHARAPVEASTVTPTATQHVAQRPQQFVLVTTQLSVNSA